MENGNQPEHTEEQVATTVENVETTTSSTVETTEVSEEQVSQEPAPIDRSAIALELLKEQGFEVNSIEDLQKFKQAPVVVDPYADVLDDEDRRYFEFKKQTGKGRDDFDALRIDPETIDPLDYAIEKARRESGIRNLSREDALDFLEEELGFIDINDLSGKEKIKLGTYIKDIREERVKEYTNLNNNLQPKPQQQVTDEMITLENGQKVSKAEYQKLEQSRQQYVNSNKEALNSVSASEFKILFEDNGSQREVSLSYEFNDQDKHSMLSMTEDTSKIVQNYFSENGFDHKRFNEDAFWIVPENRNKAITSLIQKALAMNTEEVLKGRGNVNFTGNKQIPESEKEGIVNTPISDIFKGMGLRR